MKKVIMKKVILSIVALCLVAFCLVGCAWHVMDIIVPSWQSVYEDKYFPIAHNFGKYYHKRSSRNNIDYVIKVSDGNNFEKKIVGNNNLWRTEANKYGRRILIFFEDGNFYSVEKVEAKNKYHVYGDYGRYIGKGDKPEIYYFPFFNAWHDSFAEGFVFLRDNPNPIEVKNDWGFYYEFYSKIGETYCKIDKENKAVWSKAALGKKRRLSEGYAVKLTFSDKDGKHYVSIELFE